MASEHFYSRLVAWLKILLPLVALGILSSVVFFARDADDQRTIPFVTQEGGPDTPSERVTHAEYVGLTGDGSSITVRAEHVVPVDGNTEVLDATTVSGEIAGDDGQTFDATSPEANINLAEDIARFFGEVTVVTSDGFDVVTQGLDTRLDATEASSDGPVFGTAPFGTLEAGTMRYTAPAGERRLLLFNKGVKLIYEPRSSGGSE